MSTPAYDRIGAHYDATRKADPYIVERLLALLDTPIGRVLDIGCGTGNYTLALAGPERSMTGLDPSTEMLGKARLKSTAIDWVQGHVERIPLPANSFDAAVAVLTLHHWNELSAGFAQLAKVLVPAGRLVILSSTPEQMQRYWLCHYFPIAMERSAAKMPSAQVVERSLESAGFRMECTEKYFVRKDLQDLFLQCGKHRPELYFDDRIRRGISTFAALADTDEIASGLARLRADLESGRWTAVMQRYESDAGDYLFVKAALQA